MRAAPNEIEDDPNACDCRRLVRVLAEEEELPEHVCLDTASLSCHEWLKENWPLPMLVPVAELYEVHHYAADLLRGRGYDNPAVVHLSITPHVRVQCSSPATWPIPVFGSDDVILLIMRQWVEDSPEEGLIRELQSHRNWSRALEYVREEVRQDPRQLETWQAEAWEGVNPQISARLSGLGLPSTPGTQRYFLSQVRDAPASASSIFPTRGVLVTSFGLAPPLERDQSRDYPVREHGEMLFQIRGSSSWATTALLQRAGELTVKHAKWWSMFPDTRAPYHDMRRFNGPSRRDNPLRQDVLACLENRISYTEVLDREKKREEQKLGGSLKNTEEEKVKARVQKALWRAKKNSENAPDTET